jgi:hypothetical protein
MYQMSAFRGGKKSGVVKRADSLLKPLVRDLGIEDGIRFAQIKSHWQTLFQKPLSQHMSPSFLSGNELLLTVDSPVWLQELKFYQQDIIMKLALYEVKTVRFRLGRVNADEKSESGRGERVKPLTAHDRSFIEDTVSTIEDKELREVVKKAMGKAIATVRTK